MITDDRLAKRQLQTRNAREGRKAAALRRRLDKHAAALDVEGWTVLMPDGTPWTKPGDAR